MPDAQDTHVLLVLLDMKNNSVHTVPFAKQQMAGGKPKLFCLGNYAATVGSLPRLKMASNNRVSHLSAWRGAAARMRSNAAYASASAGAVRLTRYAILGPHLVQHLGGGLQFAPIRARHSLLNGRQGFHVVQALLH